MYTPTHQLAYTLIVVKSQSVLVWLELLCSCGWLHRGRGGGEGRGGAEGGGGTGGGEGTVQAVPTRTRAIAGKERFAFKMPDF